MSTIQTFIGNIGQEPELSYSQSGIARLAFSIGSSERVKDGDQWTDGPTSWRRVTAWRGLAEGLAEQLAKGKRVVVVGKEQVREYEKDGQKRISVEVTAEHVALYLFPKARGGAGRPQTAPASTDEPWSTPAAQAGSQGGDWASREVPF